ncbi:MAG TPA: DMT family transporter [Jatrophihabitantaceae bacterium]|jgi:drug/metabolite transporter (DMT)-like permease|nr:DMT family transporter [Jatrophihabitantaceae bacterium]
MAQRTAGLVLAMISAATFGTSGSFASALLGAGWSPGAVVLVRISVGALLLAVPTLISLRGRAQLVRASGGVTLVYGVVAVALAQVCFFNAVAHVPVGVALLLEYLGVVLVVAWMWLRHHHRPQRLTVAGTAVVLVGLSFVLDLYGGVRFDMVGVLWGLGAAVGLAGYFVLSARSVEALPPVATAGLGMAVGAVALALAGVSGVMPMRAHFGAVRFAGQHVSWLVPVAGLSVVAAAIAYVAGISAAVRLGPKLASFVGLTEVLFAVLFAWGLLGQLPTVGQLFGGLLIIAGIVLVKADVPAAPVAGTEAEPSEFAIEPLGVAGP